ncbi:MAG: C-GCAxxG-C-C family protein [Prevotellaceae bacterium]|jgi:C_GCAxxG_C_C family probable redox protein|nr:C-GCAxxG-C-C family protein [Prevotellaceae bacterium]
MESRVEKVILLFKQGYNCAQSVFAAYADLFGRDSEMSFKLATPFGGGLAGMCEVCGTVSAMCMVAGLAKGITEPGDKEGKKSCFELVHVLTDKFRQENGSIIRKQLIGLEPCVSVDFKRKLCVEQVRYCAQLYRNVNDRKYW